jgi:hypothetical protein
MRRVRLAIALRDGLGTDQQAPGFLLERIARDSVILEPGLAFARREMEFPVVPGAGEVFALERSFAERTADVVADAAHGTEPAVHEGQRDGLAIDRHDAAWRGFEGVDGAKIDPLHRAAPKRVDRIIAAPYGRA